MKLIIENIQVGISFAKGGCIICELDLASLKYNYRDFSTASASSSTWSFSSSRAYSVLLGSLEFEAMQGKIKYVRVMTLLVSGRLYINWKSIIMVTWWCSCLLWPLPGHPLCYILAFIVVVTSLCIPNYFFCALPLFKKKNFFFREPSRPAAGTGFGLSFWLMSFSNR